MIRPITAALVLALLPLQPLAAKTSPSIATSQPERMIALEGGRNFRDVGGYRTADGQQVRWGRLYRAGSLGNLASSRDDQAARHRHSQHHRSAHYR